jgi:stage IV sporulation protein FB
MATILIMKNILTKFKVNNVTYFLFLVYLITGHIKNIILIFLIIIIHECGHIFFLKLFHYKIISVEIFPFGGITKTSKLINTPINKDILVYSAGFIFQIILLIIFNLLFKINLITKYTFNLFNYYNYSILIFNILPIRPLDGGEILRLILERNLPFKRVEQITIYLSTIFLIIFFLVNIKFNLNNYIIISFIFIKIIELTKNINYVYNKFLLERHIYNISYSKIKNEKIQNLELLKKETFHYFKDKDKYISEKKLLERKFDKNNYF